MPDVIQSNGFGFVDKHTKYSASLGQMTDQLTGLLVDAFVDELNQLVPLPPHTQGAESGIDQIDGRLNNRAQCGIEFEAGRDDEHGVDETVEPVAALHDLSDSISDLCQELAQAKLRQRVVQRTGAEFLIPRWAVGHGIIVTPVCAVDDGSARLIGWAAFLIQFGGENRGLRAALHAELGEQPRYVIFHCFLREEHPRRNLLVGQPLAE